MPMTTQGAMTSPAFVARVQGGVSTAYLQLAEDGREVWVSDQSSATAFASMREATRQATRLPARLRAFGAPRGD